MGQHGALFDRSSSSGALREARRGLSEDVHRGAHGRRPCCEPMPTTWKPSSRRSAGATAPDSKGECMTQEDDQSRAEQERERAEAERERAEQEHQEAERDRQVAEAERQRAEQERERAREEREIQEAEHKALDLPGDPTTDYEADPSKTQGDED